MAVKSKRKVLNNEYNLAVLFPEIAAQWDYSRNSYSPETYYPFSNKVVSWQCNFNPEHNWDMRISQRTTGRGACPSCSLGTGTSFPEQVFCYYMKLLFRDCENRKKIHGFELDIIIPSLPFAIEYDGCYYHNKSTVMRETQKQQAMLEHAVYKRLCFLI